MGRQRQAAVKLSVIVCTRNRAQAIAPCLDSLAASLALAQPVDAEIVVVDNASDDATADVVRAWAATCDFPVNLVHEPRRGVCNARNSAIHAARGELLIWTDDDCRLDESYVRNALRYDAQDAAPVLRGGRVELGDPTDLPLTTKTGSLPRRWSSDVRSARRECLGDCLLGCNMMMRRSLFETVGPFDARTDDDIDLVYRCYVASIPIEYAPDLVVLHYHGRKDPARGHKLFRTYMQQMGALYAKFALKDADLCRPLLWDLHNAAKEIVARKNLFLPEIGFSHKQRLYYNAVGAIKYWLRRPVSNST
jgi:glycosyltransferase involved in cell wall biosynthesis